jgi:hypothetical protein
MSFRVGHFFYLVLSFLLSLFFLVLGIFSLILAWSPLVKESVAHFIANDALITTLFGIGLFLIGLSIFVYAIFIAKHRYIHLQTGHRSVTLDEGVIQSYLENYWTEQFPKHFVPTHLTVKKHSIQIVANLPYLPQTEQKTFLEKVKRDFNNLFGQTLGYSHDVQLFASFDSPKSTVPQSLNK